MEDVLLYEYTRILLGTQNGFSKYLFNHSQEENEKTALMVVKFAVETFLKCKTPEAVVETMTPEVFMTMKLDKVMPYIRMPEELDKKKDLFYLGHLLYPSKIPYNQKDLSIKVYKDMLAGELQKFPKKYLEGEDGKIRAGYCLAYLISKEMHFESVGDMYRFFSEPEGIEAIKKYKLKQACMDIFETPLDFLNQALTGTIEQDPFWFSYYKFKRLYNQTSRKKKSAELSDNVTGFPIRT